MLPEPSTTALGRDPIRRRCRINCYAFQQDAITSFRGWQYSAFYSFLQSDRPSEPLYIHLARRQLPRGKWEVMIFDDYTQTTDDGHNTVQLGICPGDGTVHLSYDHHCDVLRYRYSIRGLASDPDKFKWTATLFTPTLDYLPGLPSAHPHFGYVTYPRFGPMGDDMFCSFRDGKAGLGNDHLYLYSGSTGLFTYVGAHLTGILSNPYVHGMDYRNGRFHVSWVYRGFVHYEGWDDPLDTKHKQQAGPNGAENNHNICYAYSDDKGYTWKNGAGQVIAQLKDGSTITNDAKGIVAFEISRNSGLTNQEAQAIDQEGGVHVLNRDTTDGGTKPMWKHYYRPRSGTWTQRPIRPVSGNSRGRLAVSKAGDLYIVLPNTAASEMRILKASKASGYASYDEVWTGHGLTGEPLTDTHRLEHDNVLSLLVLAEGKGEPRERNVVVLDFPL
ncbi:Dockerin type 1 [Madurella fahalii]|uniref:Dockerin type 1 n=1 Tax=Madurella fahalii TaxID=1157608 RepID=A0ABQ0FWG0_9PEZI